MKAICDTRWAGASLLPAVALLLGVAGCTAPPSAGVALDPLLHVTSQHGLVFMTQNRRPSEVMDALFTGGVVADEAGCLRLDSEEGATVVWPKGFELDKSGGIPRVLDDGGAPVGALGEEFVLAGGEVELLLESMGFTAQDRERSERCLGRYWIVNEGS